MRTTVHPFPGPHSLSSRLRSTRLFSSFPVFVPRIPSPPCFSRRAVNGPETLLGTVIFGHGVKTHRGIHDGSSFEVDSVHKFATGTSTLGGIYRVVFILNAATKRLSGAAGVAEQVIGFRLVVLLAVPECEVCQGCGSYWAVPSYRSQVAHYFTRFPGLLNIYDDARSESTWTGAAAVVP